MTGYILKEEATITQEMWDACLCSSSTATRSQDGKVLLKFESSNVPNVFAGEVVMTAAEACVVIQGPEWSNPPGA
tara:strand:- start:23791 stop:24015 length:225 start_codon:yes stop_codon:yes gene_type:complete